MTVKVTEKFVRAQGGIGPNCYPGSPGEADRGYCLDKIVEGWEIDINFDIDKLVGSVPRDWMGSVGLLGDDFYVGDSNVTKPRGGGGTNTLYGTFITSLIKRDEFKKAYNANLNANKSGYENSSSVAYRGSVSTNNDARIPALARQAEYFKDRVDKRAYVVAAFEHYMDVGIISNCYCHDFIQDTCNKIEIINTPRDDAASEDDVVDDDNASSVDNVIGSENNSIPIIFGQHRAHARLIERRNNDLIFGVSQFDSSLMLNRIWFKDTLVYDAGKILRNDLLLNVVVNNHEYKDLFTVTLSGADLTKIMFSYSGIVYVEAIQSPVQENNVLYNKNNSHILFVDAVTGFISTTDGIKDVYVHGQQVIDGDLLVAQVMRKPDSFYNRFDGYIYWQDKKLSPYSSGVETFPFVMSYPLGVSSEGVIINNTHYLKDGKQYSFKYPFGNASVFIGDIGVSSSGHELFEFDIDSRNVIVHNLPVSISYDSLLIHEKSNTLVMLDKVNGLLHIIDTDKYDWIDTINYGASLTGIFNGSIPESGIVTLIDSTTKEIIYFSVYTKEFINSGIIVPYTFSTYAVVNDMIIGELSGGTDVIIYSSGFRNDVTINSMVEALSNVNDIKWASVIEPFTGYLATGAKSHLDFLLNISKAYNLYAYNIGGIGNIMKSTFDVTNELDLIKTYNEGVKEYSISDEDDGALIKFKSIDVNYDDIKVEIDAPDGIDISFSTLAIMDNDSTFARARDLIGRENGDNLYTVLSSLPINIEYVPGKIAYTCYIDIHSLSLHTELSYILGNDSTSTRLTFSNLYTPEGTKPSSSLPGFYTAFSQTKRSVICNGHVIGTAVSSLRNDNSSYHIQLKDSKLIVEFIDNVTIGASQKYHDLLNDPFLNLICVGGEWIQYQYAEWVTSNRVILSGLMRGRFLSYPEKIHSSGEEVHFYSASKCVVNNNDSSALPPIRIVPAVMYYKYRFTEDSSGNPFSFFWNAKDAVDVDFDVPFNLQQIKTFIGLIPYGFNDIRDIYEEANFADEYQTYIGMVATDRYLNDPVVNEVRANVNNMPDPDLNTVNGFFLSRGKHGPDSSYILQQRKFEGVELVYYSYSDDNIFSVSGFVDGDKLDEYPSITDYKITFSTPFNPYKEKFSYEIH
jgi:hypothetical protein